MIQARDITALILAGGRGSRMGGVDKGLQPFNGLPLVQHTLARLQQGAGVGAIMLNANRNLSIYQTFGLPVWPDSLTDYPGPLAGFLTGLAHCPTPYLLTVPCDTPLFPLDLVQRLAAALQATHASIAMASAPEASPDGTLHMCPQPVCCLLRVELRASLHDFIQNGGRKVQTWTALHPTTVVPFDAPGDHPQAFFNANTLAQLQQLEQYTP